MRIVDLLLHYLTHIIGAMVDVSQVKPSGGKWVCPNDRHLALRAKLKTGWSVKTQDLQQYGAKPAVLNEAEQNVIKEVIERAEVLDKKEQERVGKLVDRVDNMKRNVLGNGTTQCILCGDGFGMFGAINYVCNDCKKLVCEKCGIEMSGHGQEVIRLCKICSETREMWKKSGAWFFKGLPKYKLPEKKMDKYDRRLTRPGLEQNTWSKSHVDLTESSIKTEISPEEDTSSEEEKKKKNKKKKLKEEDVARGTSSAGLTVTLGAGPMEKSPRSPGALSSISGSLFFNTSSDSGMGESERNIVNEKAVSPNREPYQREVSNESCDSTYSRQTSSSLNSDSHSTQHLTSSTTYLSSMNQSYERLALSYDKNKYQDKPPLYYDYSPTFNKAPFSKKSPIGGERPPAIHQTDTSQPDRLEPCYERSGRKLPVPSPRKTTDRAAMDRSESSKVRKKVSIDFGKAAAFLKKPLRSDSISGGGRKKKLNKFSASETSLDSSIVSPEDGDAYYEQERNRGQNDLEANHWLSQESGMDFMDSASSLEYTSRWREDSMSSLAVSKDIFWSEDQTSLSSSVQTAETDLVSPSTSRSAQLGSVELSLWYDPVRTALHCTLHRGKGLRATDMHGLSDPFCKLSILPTTASVTPLRTKTVHKTRNPEFNETVTFYGIAETHVVNKTLHIVVLDDDKYGTDFLGEARIPLLNVGAKKTKHLHVVLDKPVAGRGETEEQTAPRGQILVTLSYSTKKRALIVTVGRCVNLLAMDNNGFSDPFVKLYLRPDSNHKKHKTSIKWKTLNPVFDEEFTFETRMTDLPKQSLVMSVWDKDYAKSNDYLGGLELGCRSKGERLKHWIDMIKFPDHKHEGWHRLGEDLVTD